MSMPPRCERIASLASNVMTESAGIGTVKGPGRHPTTISSLRRTRSAASTWQVRLLPGRRGRRVAPPFSVASPGGDRSLFPDSFLADRCAACVGGRVARYDSNATELFGSPVTVLGYHSGQMGDFIAARTAGSWVAVIASDELLVQVLSKQRKGRARHRSSAACSAGRAQCPWRWICALHRHASGRHRQHGRQQATSPGVLLESDDAAQPGVGARRRPARLSTPRYGDDEILGAGLPRATTNRACALPPRPVACASIRDAGDLRHLLPTCRKMHYQLGRAFFAQRSAKNGHYTLERLLFAVRQSAEAEGRQNGFDGEDPTTSAHLAPARRAGQQPHLPTSKSGTGRTL